MKEIKILYLYPDLMCLYGESGNMFVLQRELEAAGYTVKLTRWEDGEMDLNQDLIYIGGGTEDNLMMAAKWLQPYAEQIRASVESGTLWLATGNAMALFGQSITRKDETVPGLGVFGHTTTVDDAVRYIGDVIADCPCLGDTPFIGNLNTSCIYEGVAHPMMHYTRNAPIGAKNPYLDDGIQEGNFYATQLAGPVLPKDPHFLEFIAEKLTGEPLRLPEDGYMKKAYAASLEYLRYLQSQEEK